LANLQIDADPDLVPNPAYHFDADPDPYFYLMLIWIWILFDADPDADPGYQNTVMRIRMRVWIHNTGLQYLLLFNTLIKRT
jgi:hypothetical protein